MAFYNLKKKPALTTKEGETETMYADIVYSGTIPAERLNRGVAKRTGFKEGVIEGILIELKEDVLQYLGEGYRVELGEFGFFSAKVKASRLVANKNDIRSESVAFNGVNFRASKSMRVGIRGDLERRKCVDFNTSCKWDRENLKNARLQGFPDWWCRNLGTEDPTEEELAFWADVFETHRKIVTHAKKPKTEKQIRKWLADPYTDSAEYRIWGNGICLANAFFVLAGIAWCAGLEE